MILPIFGIILFVFALFVTITILYCVMQIWVWAWGKKRYGKTKSEKIAIMVAILIPVTPALILAFTLILNEISKPNIEWNPQIVSDNKILGRWVDKGELLVINADGLFKFESMPYKYLRVIEYNQKYHLVKGTEHRDPDEWIYSNSFEK
jgi:hypothetical protein